ncbi:hypothetical protein GCM10011390_18830 [Aureimonas endophytica]|uniref:Uncharacterized protein n=1 Tax=Aureimonas endophytica TaxID=2027858 RepID=A0A916ZIZ3_9HYPH|nr:hypothetical protein [Aureimonas endophytica]GGE00254.1 hypothetical protein GCM10011390_18830 [Aureimonas endophytica]
MTNLEFVRDKLVEIAELGERDTATPEKLAFEALAVLEPYLERRRQSASRLLVGIDESCITRCDEVSEGAYQLRARLGIMEVAEFHLGDPETETDATIRKNVRAAILDSLRVEIVRNRVAEASDRDLLDALDAAERGGDDEVGEILVAAHDRGLRLLS